MVVVVVAIAMVTVVEVVVAVIAVVVVDRTGGDEGLGGCGIDRGTDGCPVLFTGGFVVPGWRRRRCLAQ